MLLRIIAIVLAYLFVAACEIALHWYMGSQNSPTAWSLRDFYLWRHPANGRMDHAGLINFIIPAVVLGLAAGSIGHRWRGGALFFVVLLLSFGIAILLPLYAELIPEGWVDAAEERFASVIVVFVKSTLICGFFTMGGWSMMHGHTPWQRAGSTTTTLHRTSGGIFVMNSAEMVETSTIQELISIYEQAHQFKNLQLWKSLTIQPWIPEFGPRDVHRIDEALLAIFDRPLRQVEFVNATQSDLNRVLGPNSDPTIEVRDQQGCLVYESQDASGPTDRVVMGGVLGKLLLTVDGATVIDPSFAVLQMNERLYLTVSDAVLIDAAESLEHNRPRKYVAES